ncbi:MAG: MBL fold metallo-hydrolase [Bdellovibrio sp. CG10_big_fil_rev_8_21_14_0_10_47_8]|nr:MAG: MBL fold metallo-hydrolase [Bdellovibrio sp. CG10_big_fil_rev_8_21_14_0_10_47_8]
MNKNLIFYQLFEHETSTYTYLLGDAKSKEAVLIDPVLETVDRDLQLVNDLGLKLKYVLDTHVHADHVTGAGEIRKRTQAKTAVSADAKVACMDVPLHDGDTLQFGTFEIKALSTPGHTDSCMSYVCEGMAFTGDALLIRGCGRTDFQQGSSHKLFQSVTHQLFTLPPDTVVYPGHDYRGQTKSSVEIEKKFNPRLGGGKTEAEFVKLMSELKLAQPKKIHEAVPANMACGNIKSETVLHPQMVNDIPEITPENLKPHLGQVRLIDVRRPDEYVGELGHIPGAELITQGDALDLFFKTNDKSQEIVFVCRSGGRSGKSTFEARQQGFKNVANMTGGMIRWNELKFPIESNQPHLGDK